MPTENDEIQRGSNKEEIKGGLFHCTTMRWLISSPAIPLLGTITVSSPPEYTAVDNSGLVQEGNRNLHLSISKSSTNCTPANSPFSTITTFVTPGQISIAWARTSLSENPFAGMTKWKLSSFSLMMTSASALKGSSRILLKMWGSRRSFFRKAIFLFRGTTGWTFIPLFLPLEIERETLKWLLRWDPDKKNCIVGLGMLTEESFRWVIFPLLEDAERERDYGLLLLDFYCCYLSLSRYPSGVSFSLCGRGASFLSSLSRKEHGNRSSLNFSVMRKGRFHNYFWKLTLLRLSPSTLSNGRWILLGRVFSTKEGYFRPEPRQLHSHRFT